MPGRTPALAFPRLHFIEDAAGDDGGDGCAFEGAGVEGGVAGFAGGLVYLVGPFVSGGENG